MTQFSLSDIQFQTSLEGVTPAQLGGFFEGWPNPPTPETLWRILDRAAVFVLARTPDGQVIGFVNALSDGILAASIPLLEVQAGWRSLGLGSELMRRVLTELGDLYMVDLSCDDDVVPFYERLGLKRANAMFLRRYDNQAGTPAE